MTEMSLSEATMQASWQLVGRDAHVTPHGMIQFGESLSLLAALTCLSPLSTSLLQRMRQMPCLMVVSVLQPAASKVLSFCHLVLSPFFVTLNGLYPICPYLL